MEEHDIEMKSEKNMYKILRKLSEDRRNFSAI